MRKLFVVLFTIVAVVGIAQFNGDKQRTSYHSVPCECVLPYKYYAAQVTQTGTNDPVVTVLHNDLGTITWERTSQGQFEITSSSAFTLGQTQIFFNQSLSEYAGSVYVQPMSDPSVISVTTQSDQTDSDDEFSNTAVVIYVY
jgi:hypothetical protein